MWYAQIPNLRYGGEAGAVDGANKAGPAVLVSTGEQVTVTDRAVQELRPVM